MKVISRADGTAVLFNNDTGQVWNTSTPGWEAAPAGPGAIPAANLITPSPVGGFARHLYTIPAAVLLVDWGIDIFWNDAPQIGDLPDESTGASLHEILEAARTQ